MRPTGYALLALAALLCAFAGVADLVFASAPVEGSGPVNAQPRGTGSYWLALLPAAACAGVGLWLVLTKQKGYKTDYDLRHQQS